MYDDRLPDPVVRIHQCFITLNSSGSHQAKYYAQNGKNHGCFECMMDHIQGIPNIDVIHEHGEYQSKYQHGIDHTQPYLNNPVIVEENGAKAQQAVQQYQQNNRNGGFIYGYDVCSGLYQNSIGTEYQRLVIEQLNFSIGFYQKETQQYCNKQQIDRLNTLNHK